MVRTTHPVAEDLPLLRPTPCHQPHEPQQLVVGSTRLMPGLVPPVRQTAYVGSLAGVLHRVTNHTDQPDRGGHRGIPTGIHDPIQLIRSNVIQVAQRQLVNIPVIVAEEVATHPDRRYILWALAITGGPLVERQPKPLPPLRPHLLNLRQFGHLMVLAAGEVPEQPANRVGFRIRAVAGDFIGQTVGEIDNELSHPPEGISQNLLRIFSHITEPYWLRLRLSPRRPVSQQIDHFAVASARWSFAIGRAAHGVARSARRSFELGSHWPGQEKAPRALRTAGLT